MPLLCQPYSQPLRLKVFELDKMKIQTRNQLWVWGLNQQADSCVYKVLLKHSPTSLSAYMLWLLSQHNSRFEQLQQGPWGSQSKKYLFLTLYRTSLQVPGLKQKRGGKLKITTGCKLPQYLKNHVMLLKQTIMEPNTVFKITQILPL